MDPVNLRNLDQIQEEDQVARSPLGTLFLASLGGAALVTVAVMTRQAPESTASRPDPLAELVERVKDKSQPPGEVDQSKVTFPDILSDHAGETTALAAVKDERGRLLEPDTALQGAEPPPATDKLPVVPLPVGDVLTSTTVTQEPRDSLTQLAAQVVDEDGASEMVQPGTEGGYQLQVASFKEMSDADKLVEKLLRRGHRAYRQAANVPSRGLWHRVRIGPFQYKYQAERYQKSFEETERMSTFLVDPEKVKRQQAIRDAKQAARDKKKRRRQAKAE